MPQWDFLNFLSERGRRYPGFHLRMNSEVAELLEENGNVVGVKGKSSGGPFEVRARLTIGADGRHSFVREKAGLQINDLGAPIDVLWMRLSKQSSDTDLTLGYFRTGKVLVTINRSEYWQCARVIPKGAFDHIRQQGLPAFREEIVEIAPFFRDRVGELKDWNDIKLLSVAVDHLHQWFRPGLLCIGDSAHAMSPIGGVGINLAIQDAVAAANILVEPLLHGRATAEHLSRVQQRRELPTRLTQFFQVQAHKRILGPLLSGQMNLQQPPLAARLLRKFPVLCRIPARLIGMGFRPEHVKTLEIDCPK
jgi:2-polyprenyl-6-methoxyphenol hydroxylase-like FAD-dependent oxidoreductase